LFAAFIQVKHVYLKDKAFIVCFAIVKAILVGCFCECV